MASLQKLIADKFLDALAAREDVDAAQVAELRQLLSRDKKPKTDEFIRVFTTPRGGEVK